jgi:hypothetical protein
VLGLRPSSSAAAAITVFITEPGSKISVSARLSSGLSGSLSSLS